MQVRTLGDTGIRATRLGYGGGRLAEVSPGELDLEKSAELLRMGLDAGINYLDTAHVYHNGQSETAIGMAIQGVERSTFTLTTKVSADEKEEDRPAAFRQKLETSLKRMGTPYVDFLLLHGMRWEPFHTQVCKPGDVLDEARKAQSEGLIRHLGFSSHDRVENVIHLIETREFELLLLQYNYLDRHNEPAFARAHELGMGVTVMGPVAAGKLDEPGTVLLDPDSGLTMRAPELALRFVWMNPNVDVALSGMNSLEQLQENLASANSMGSVGDVLNQQVLNYIDGKQALADAYCSLCGKCLPCPNDVHVPENFRYMNWFKVWGLPVEARNAYAALNNDKGVWLPWDGHIKGLKADACQECGECEPKCPQRIPIIQQLKETAAALGG